MKSEIVLRSSSPRRREIMNFLGFTFQISPSRIDEESFPKEKPLEYLQRITINKLGTTFSNQSSLYISADTIVVWEDKIFPKPNSPEINYDYLQILNGKTHSVYSGIGIWHKNKIYFSYEETQVKFKNLNNEQIREYIEYSKPFDKAGGYGIQDEKSPVEDFTGSYWNVVGFPLRSFFSYHDLWSDFLIKQ